MSWNLSRNLFEFALDNALNHTIIKSNPQKACLDPKKTKFYIFLYTKVVIS